MIIDVIMNMLFWIGLIQWATLSSLVLVIQRVTIPRAHQFVEIVLDLIVFIVVTAFVIFVPLYATGNLPVHADRDLSVYMYGFVLGALVSIPIRQFVARSVQRKGAWMRESDL